MLRRFTAVALAWAALASGPGSEGTAAADRASDTLQRLSLDLRGTRLTTREREEMVAELARKRAPATVFQAYLERWLTPAAYTRLLGAFLPSPSAGVLFIDVLSRFRAAEGDAWTYYLPHTLPRARRATDPPCLPSEAVAVHPWWAVAETIRICPASYRPDHAFDGSGYCAGQPSIGMTRNLPREGCGCGPLLMACLPPEETRPHLVEDLSAALAAERMVTALDVVTHDRSFDELHLTSRTWQSGLVEFFYLRRELLALVATQPYTDKLLARLEAEFKKLDLARAGRWVERGDPYRGSGLFTTTPAESVFTVNYRDYASGVLENSLCKPFKSVHVDAEAVLRTVVKSEDRRIWKSPMLKQAGCRNCHIPMDNIAAFLAGLSTTQHGSYPTGISLTGRLYVGGPDDFRGEAVGFEGLSRLIVAQPEFDACIVQRTFAEVLHRDPVNSEIPWVRELTANFKAGGRKWSSLVKALYTSPSYTGL